MEVLILITLLAGFSINLLVIRHLFKRLSNKIAFHQPSFSTEVEQSLRTETVTSSTKPLDHFPFQQKMDKPVKNQVMDEDLNDVEFSEQTFASFPTGLKVDVEGGDTQIPPGFPNK